MELESELRLVWVQLELAVLAMMCLRRLEMATALAEVLDLLRSADLSSRDLMRAVRAAVSLSLKLRMVLVCLRQSMMVIRLICVQLQQAEALFAQFEVSTVGELALAALELSLLFAAMSRRSAVAPAESPERFACCQSGTSVPSA